MSALWTSARQVEAHVGVITKVGPTAEARLLSCNLQDSGSDVVVLIPRRRIEYRLGAVGEHWVPNSIVALAVVEAVKAGDVIAVKGLLGSKINNVVDAIVAASGGEGGPLNVL